jgi:hypothetical protein
MSGDHFDGISTRLESFIEQLSSELKDHAIPNEYGDTPYDYSPEVLRVVGDVLSKTSYLKKLIREVELLYSGDNGEDSFLKAIAELQ